MPWHGGYDAVRRLLALAVAIAVVAGATSAWAAAGTLDLGPSWGAADQTDTDRVELSYAIKASGNVPQEAVDAVHAGIDRWNAAIDGRESGWELDLVPLDGASTSSSSGGRPSFHHEPDHANGGGNGKGGGGNGGGGGEDPDISIHLKKGGGMVAGSAQRTTASWLRPRSRSRAAPSGSRTTRRPSRRWRCTSSATRSGSIITPTRKT